MSQKNYQAPFIPRDIMRIKFYKEHSRFPTEEDEAYVFDTRWFSSKYTNRDVAPVQAIMD